MLKSSVSALTILVALAGPAMAATITQNQGTSVGVVGASINNIGVAGLSNSSSGALGLGVATNVNTVTQNANPLNVNLNSLHQMEQQGQGQGQLQF
jgi:hypothetical protein